MNAWTYFATAPSGAFFLALVLGWSLVALVRAWRGQRVTHVHLVECEECGKRLGRYHV